MHATFNWTYPGAKNNRLIERRPSLTASADLARFAGGRRWVEQEQHDRHKTESCACIKRRGCAQAFPQLARDNARYQRHDAAQQIEETERRTAQMRRRRMCDHRSKQALRHAHVQPPKRDAHEDYAPVGAMREYDVSANQHEETSYQQRGMAHRVHKFSARISGERVNDVHCHHYQWNERNRYSAPHRTKDPKRLAESRQRENRAYSDDPFNPKAVPRRCCGVTSATSASRGAPRICYRTFGLVSGIIYRD